MGLSGAKTKQRIPDDPRNTRWANDVSAPGFRLLSSMGWTPDAPGLGLAASQDLIKSGGSTAYSKKISVIPSAKDDNLGIGARRGAGIGGMRAMGVPMGAMGFVTASGETGEPQEAPKTGGEFGRLLERLNKAKEEAAAAAKESGAPVVEVEVAIEETEKQKLKREKRERKEAKKEKKDKKRKRSEEDEDEETSESATPGPTVSTVMEVELDSLPTSGASTPTVLKNPRMAARSKHLRAKRLAAGNSLAMAEILGIAPTSSTSASPSGSPAPERHSSIPSTGLAPSAFGAGIGSGGAGGGGIGSGVRSEPVVVAPPSAEGWPTAPPRAFPTFASASTSTQLAATFEPPAAAAASVVVEAPKPAGMAAYANMFAKASTSASAIPATFTADSTPAVEEEEVKVVEVAEESEKARLKREKKEAKEAKRAKKALKAGSAAAAAVEESTPASTSTGTAATSLEATPAVEAMQVDEGEDDAAREKRKKRERKEAKRAKKEAKVAKAE